jgi:peptide/nickel transport system permease protein
LLEVLRADYIRTARAKGLTEGVVWFRHALRNAALPLATVLGLELALLLTGAVIVETVFAWPGIGRLAVDAVSSRDYPVVQSAVLLISFIFVAINLIVDLSYNVLDPRVRNG